MGIAGRPKGSITTPQFKNYVTEKDRESFVAWVMKAFKKNPRLATWAGDQMFGRAAQPLVGVDGGPLIIEVSEVIKRKNDINSGAK